MRRREWAGLGWAAIAATWAGLAWGQPPTVRAALTFPGLPALRAPGAGRPAVTLSAEQEELVRLRAAMAAEVPGLLHPGAARLRDLVARARAMLAATDTMIDAPQLVLVVDRNPAVQTLSVMLARPDGVWSTVGTVHVSTGQAGRKDHYFTPVGVFVHGDAILDFRAAGTFNENHVRGLGVAGMRVWDFGWQWAIKGWRGNAEGGDIRLQMHATDPDLLERRLGHPASEGCVRLSGPMDRFLDRHGVLDADYEREAAEEVSVAALLRPDREPSPLAGRALIVVDSALPVETPPTAESRPADWPDPQ
jgi:lipoprotein-anchoring transpeptidase ErfK/SrfK